MWWSRRFTSWMWSQEIFSDCVMLSCIYQNLWGMCPAPRWICAMKGLSSSEGKNVCVCWLKQFNGATVAFTTWLETLGCVSSHLVKHSLTLCTFTPPHWAFRGIFGSLAPKCILFTISSLTLPVGARQTLWNGPERLQWKLLPAVAETTLGAELKGAFHTKFKPLLIKWNSL